jgi:hypothetical protein
MRKLKKIEIKSDIQSFQLSSLIHAPIFVPTSSKNCFSKEFIEVCIDRTKDERIKFRGLQLDLSYDFQLFSIVVSRLQQTDNVNITLTEKELFKALGLPAKKKEKSKKDILELRFKKLLDCKIELDEFGICPISGMRGTVNWLCFNLLNSIQWNRSLGIIFIEVNKHLRLIRTEDFHQELININKLNKIKTQYARALYLYLQTKKFRNQIAVDHRLDQLITRFNTPNMLLKEQKRKVKVSLQELKEKRFIADFYFYKSKVQEIDMCKIVSI